MFTVVHAQISSTSRVLRSAWTVVSRGDCIFPFVSNNLAARQKQEEGYPPADWVWTARGYFQQQTRPPKRRSIGSITSSCADGAGAVRWETCCERFGTFTAQGDLERLALLGTPSPSGNKLNQHRGRTGGSHENNLWNCRGDAFFAPWYWPPRCSLWWLDPPMQPTIPSRKRRRYAHPVTVKRVYPKPRTLRRWRASLIPSCSGNWFSSAAALGKTR